MFSILKNSFFRINEKLYENFRINEKLYEYVLYYIHTVAIIHLLSYFIIVKKYYIYVLILIFFILTRITF